MKTLLWQRIKKFAGLIKFFSNIAIFLGRRKFTLIVFLISVIGLIIITGKIRELFVYERQTTSIYVNPIDDELQVTQAIVSIEYNPTGLDTMEVTLWLTSLKKGSEAFSLWISDNLRMVNGGTNIANEAHYDNTWSTSDHLNFYFDEKIESKYYFNQKFEGDILGLSKSYPTSRMKT